MSQIKAYDLKNAPKGHQTELEDGRVFTLNPGMSYQVADGAELRRSFTEQGVHLFIVD